jgi:hypothetical protein
MVCIVGGITLNGCTAIGFSAGLSTTQVETKYTLVSADPDSFSCKSRDQVEAILKDGRSFRGWVKEIDQWNTISIKVRKSQTSNYEKKDIVELQWADIHSVTRIQPSYKGFITLTVIGLLLDIGFYILISSAFN